MTEQFHVTFIHGIGNKPPCTDLKRIWIDSLEVGVKGDDGFFLSAVGGYDSFIYWADLFYKEPLLSSQYESFGKELEDSVRDEFILGDDEWTRAMRLKFPEDDEMGDLEPSIEDTVEQYERIPVPWFIKRQVMRHFIKEAHDYLFNVNGIREQIRSRVLDDLNKVSGCMKHVIAGHSLGSVIAYDVLTGVPNCKEVDGLLTFGSPLGIDEIQDHLTWSRENGFPEKLRGNWVNIYDSSDVVSRLDPVLANDFKKNGNEIVIDVQQDNGGAWRHSATKYLKGPKMRRQLRRLCNREEG